jgi:hypothetical protein
MSLLDNSLLLNEIQIMSRISKFCPPREVIIIKCLQLDNLTDNINFQFLRYIFCFFTIEKKKEERRLIIDREKAFF